MHKIEKQIFTFTSNSYFPFVVLTFFLLFFHACIHVGHGDDAYFQAALRDNNIFEWLIVRYTNWSSRLIIEFFLAILAGHHILWRLFNTAIMLLGAMSVSKIFSNKNSKITNWVVCALFLCLPESLYHSAGWIATTLNYSWVVCLGLFAMLPIKKLLHKEKINWYEYILYFCAMIYATNQEQMCIILLVVYFISICYMFYLDKTLNCFLLTSFIINFSSLVFILTCPGNASRKISEIGTWFPDYGNLSLFRKLELGYSSTLFEFIMKPNLMFLIFAVLLFFYVISKQKNMFYRFISAIPITCNLIFGFFAELFGKNFPGLLKIKSSLTQYGTGFRFRPETWIPDIVLSLVCISILISLYVVFENKKTYLLTTFILILGFSSRMIMSFSPTIWASCSRTFIFMYLSVLICSTILYQELQKQKKIFLIEFLNYIIFFIFSISLLNSFGVCIT